MKSIQKSNFRVQGMFLEAPPALPCINIVLFLSLKNSTMLMQGIVWMIPACCTIEAFKCLQAEQMFHVYDVSAIVLHILYQLQTVE